MSVAQIGHECTPAFASMSDLCRIQPQSGSGWCRPWTGLSMGEEEEYGTIWANRPDASRVHIHGADAIESISAAGERSTTDCSLGLLDISGSP